MTILTVQGRVSMLVAACIVIYDAPTKVIAVGRRAPTIIAGNALARAPPACRQPFIQPFASTSIWNTPIGANARFVDAKLYTDFNTTIFHVDTEYMIGFTSDTPTDSDVGTKVDNRNVAGTSNAVPLVPVVNQGWWGGIPPAVAAKCPVPSDANSWCHCTVIGNISDHLPIPLDFTTNTTGNNEGTVKLNETHVLQLQPVYRCGTTSTSPLLAMWPNFMRYPENHRILDVRTSNGTYGCHGGSGLSGFGGSIRKGELNASAPPIQHAIKIELYAYNWYYCGSRTNRSSCFRWPASSADGYALKCGQPPGCYNGTNPSLQPGSLLAVPTAAVSPTRKLLQTDIGKRFLDVLHAFGGYIVDDAAGAPNHGRANICYEHGVEAEVREEYGLELSAKKGSPLFDDLIVVFRALQIVDNNGPASVGGGGAPVVQPPPPLCPTTS
eukprot:m.249357 g.249357  ORF g.249357 m.249357 type:complete len:439 (+) comp19518_c0_seq2:252-1568(+)